MKSTLPNYRGELLNEKNKLQILVEPYLQDAEAISGAMREISELYQKIDRDVKPQVMVYGIYNAGKSSIINELIGEDRAIVADHPQTDRVDYYDWNGYQIADTPGVGAPIQHEEVTQEHLKKADVIIFVMAAMGANENRQNYTRMKDITDAGKKVIIVLNDKGIPGDTEEEKIQLLQTIKTQVAKNMESLGIQNVKEKYHIVVVNAQRARKGRTEGKEMLYKRSNFPELTDVILKELKRTDGFQIIRNTVYQVDRNVETIMNALGNVEGEIENSGLKEIVSGLETKKKDVRTTILAYIKNQCERLAGMLPDILWQYRENQDQLNETLQNEISALNDRVMKKMEHELEELQDELASDLQIFVEKQKNEELRIDVEKFEMVPNKSVACILPEIIDDDGVSGSSSSENLKTAELLLNNYKAGKPIFPTLMEGVCKGVGADAAITGVVVPAAEVIMTQIGKTALGTSLATMAAGTFIGKAISGVIPVIGPVIAVCSVLPMLFGDNAEDERRRAKAEAQNDVNRRNAEAQQQAEIQAKQELIQKCGYLAEDIAEDLTYAMTKVLNDCVGGVENEFKKRLSKSNESEKNRQKTLEELRNIRDRYQTIYDNLGGVIEADG